MGNQYYVYFLTNQTNKVLYVGVTNNLKRRLYQHKSRVTDGFTKKYHVRKLVYYEAYEDVEYAILREKQIKAGTRQNKNGLVESFNPEWEDLSEEL
jgi:putative endonuclease